MSLVPVDEQIALAADRAAGDRDDTLDLYFMCCHPALSVSSQIALTLRAVAGLTTAEIVTRMLVPLAPGEPEAPGLLALMLLTDARCPARIGPAGELVPLDAQDRSCWRRDVIAEGTALLEAALGHHAPGPYQIQAAIAALHDHASSTETTGQRQPAAEAYRAAANRTTSTAERTYLLLRAAQVGDN